MFRFPPISSNEDDDEENAINMLVLDAIIDDDSETFSTLLSQKQSISKKGVNYRFRITNYKLIEYLDCSPPLASICAFFAAEKCLSTLLLMIPDGLKSKDVRFNGYCEIPLISYAAAGGSIQIFRQLYEAGYDLSEKDSTGQCPCHYATIFGRIDVLKYIISKGIDVFDDYYEFAMRPLHFACYYGYLDIVKFLCENVATKNQLKYINANCPIENRNQTPLFYASLGGHCDVVEYLLTIDVFYNNHINLIDESGESPLNVAIVQGNFDCVVALMKTGKCRLINPGREHIPLVDAAFNNRVDIFKYLLKNGANLNDKTCKGTDCILGAACGNAVDMLEYMYKEGFFVDFPEERLYQLVTMSFLLNCMGSVYFLDENFTINYQRNVEEYFGFAINNNSLDVADFLIGKHCKIDDLEKYENNSLIRTHFLRYLKLRFVDPYGIRQEEERKIIEYLNSLNQSE